MKNLPASSSNPPLSIKSPLDITMYNIEEIRQVKRTENPDSRLNQGTPWWWPPYTISETWEYLKGFLSTGRTSQPNSDALLGKNTPTHVVGIERAAIPHGKKCSDEPENFLVVGDILWSKNGKTIVLGEGLKAKIRKAKVIVLNVESPVTLDNDNSGRGGLLANISNGLKFALHIPTPYLEKLVNDIKTENPKIQIIYDIANNHTLDSKIVSYEQLIPFEQTLYDFDKQNVPIYRTIYAIRKIDKEAKIIGVFTHDREFLAFPIKGGASVNLKTDPVAVVKLNGLQIGFLAATDILNYNDAHWKSGRVIRPEDIEDKLTELKKHYNLDKLFLVMHGGIEQNLYPSSHWQKLHERLAEHCDGIFSHGSHLPGLFQVKKTNQGNVPLETSLGNFYCPTNLKNTAVSTILSGEVTKDSIIYEEAPIETTAIDNHPKVDMLDRNIKTYPGLRWFKMHPQKYPECQLDQVNENKNMNNTNS